MFKRDFVGELLDTYSDQVAGLRLLLSCDANFPQDDVNWFR